MMRPISFQTRTLIYCVISFLITIFILTLLVSLLVNHWKQRLVDNSIELAEKHARDIAGNLSDIYREKLSEDMQDLREDLSAHSCIELLLKQNEHIVMAALVDQRGAMIIQHYQGEATTGTARLDPGENYSRPLGSPGSPELDVILRNRSGPLRELNMPIMQGERMLGQLRFSVSENAIMESISYSSRLITRSLTVLVIIVAVLLLIIFLFLWRFFSRHLSLVQERDRLDKLASIGTLASGLAHEIRNPLNAMNVNLDVIREEIEDPREDSPGKASELLASLQREIGQLNRTLSDFMKFAIPGKLEKQSSDLVHLVHETMGFFSGEFERQMVDTSMDLPESCPLKADPTSIKQLLMNLILNALQAMVSQPKKTIQIRIFPDGRFCHLTLTDNGPGFGKTDPEKCFEVFHTTKSEGSGFGLPIARQVANAHGGSLRAENNPSGGACFHLLLPR